MRSRRSWLTTGLILAATMLSFAPPVPAAIFILAGGEGTEDPPAPTPDAEVETDWNPTLTCTVDAAGDIVALLTCLQAGIIHTGCPPSSQIIVQGGGTDGGAVQVMQQSSTECSNPQDISDFTVTWLNYPYTGLQIRRNDGTEIQRLTLRENDPGIQTTLVSVEQPNLAAWIKEIGQQPSTGLLTVRLNGRPVTVDTGAEGTARRVTDRLAREIQQAGFRLLRKGKYLVVTWDDLAVDGSGGGITSVEFRSQDAAIFMSDISLLPFGEDPQPLLLAPLNALSADRLPLINLP